MIENKKTKAWELYELGRTYNEELTPNQYNVVNTNIEFFIGNQWLRLPNTPAMAGLAKPTFNILKRVSSLFIASPARRSASSRSPTTTAATSPTRSTTPRRWRTRW